ncbi:30S ribosomal protein S20 [Candidatus Uhrbacteria bacterium]|nr:30S ribosomal protein S20 [Candidatus Uhrbacteria bacterium]
MPIKHAAEKALRQTKKRTARNTNVFRHLETLEKQVRKFIADKSTDAKTVILHFQKTIDKAVRKHIIKPNTAARQKGRLMRLVK